MIGYAGLVWVWANEFGSDILWIDEIVIDENFRGHGIGKKFFSWLQSAYGNSPAFSLLVSEDNQKAQELYQEIGFKPKHIEMLKVNNVRQMAPANNIRELVQAV